MKKRVFAVLLAAILSLSVLAGCKPSDQPDDDTATTTTTVADQGGEDVGGEEETDPSGEEVTDPSGEEETDPSEEETLTTETDAKGNTVTTKKTYNKKTNTKTTTTKKQNNNGTTKKNTSTTKKQDAGSSDSPASPNYTMPFKETQTWSLFLTELSYQPIKDNTIKFETIYELTNVNLELDIGEGASAETKLMAAAASGKFYDIAHLNNTQFRTYKTSLFYDITDRIKTDTPNYYNAVKKEWSDLQLFSTGGRFYGFAQTDGGYQYDEPSVLAPWVRVDVFEDNNIKKPTTWKEWFEAMKLLKKKTPESQPFASRSTTYILNYWPKMLGQAYNIYYDDKTEKWECGVLNASVFKNILQFMKDCYDEGILDQNFDQSSDKNFQDLATASLTFFSIDSGTPFSKANQILAENNKKAMFIAIDPFASHLNGGKTTTWYWPQSINFQNAYYIGSQAKNIDELLFFMDWCYTDEGYNTNNYGKLGVTYEVSNGKAYVPEKVWKAKWPEGYAARGYEWMSEFGLNQSCFAPYMNVQDKHWENYNMDDDDMYNHPWLCNSVEVHKKGYTSAQFNLSPDVSPEMTERYNTLQNYLKGQIIAFIKGDREMSEYDTFVVDLKAMGIEELLKACNA